jgi:hypothetical protein
MIDPIVFDGDREIKTSELKYDLWFGSFQTRFKVFWRKIKKSFKCNKVIKEHFDIILSDASFEEWNQQLIPVLMTIIDIDDMENEDITILQEYLKQSLLQTNDLLLRMKITKSKVTYIPIRYKYF